MMKAGKLSPSALEDLVLRRVGRRRDDVLVGAAIGEDAAVLDFGGEVCVVSSDPITGAGQGAGRLAVHISCNDIAAGGASPIGVVVVLLLPEETKSEDIAALMEEMEEAAAELGIDIVGGHTEITSKVTSPVVITTALGRAPRHRFVTSFGFRPGDAVLVTKGVGLEGTAILACDWEAVIAEACRRQPALLAGKSLEALLANARGFYREISAVKDGEVAAAFGATAMHDLTEGGLYGGLYEMARGVKGAAFRIYRERVPVREGTAIICRALDLDPLGLISSGAMLITTADGPGLRDHLQKAGITAYIIGEVIEGDKNILVEAGGDEKIMPGPVEDELWRFLAAQPV